MKYIEMARELLGKNSFKNVDSKVKELLLKAYETINYAEWIEATEDICFDKKYDVWKLTTNTTDFQRYILN